MRLTRFSEFHLLLLLLVVFVINGCATGKTVLVLLPDADGKVGSIEISNKYGSKTIDQTGYAISVSSNKAPPTPIIMPAEEVKRIFAEALVAEPLPPAKHILYFFWDSSNLRPDSLSVMQEIIVEIKKRVSTDISVNGHTDRSGLNEFNLGLSRRRAKKVRDLLVAGGVSPEAISVASHGEGNPLIKTADNVPELRNRRVEVIIR